MQKEMIAETADRTDEELHDVLIAISVVAKRLAKKLEDQKIKGDKQCRDMKTSSTVSPDRR